jgi:hypothetical protein
LTVSHDSISLRRVCVNIRHKNAFLAWLDIPPERISSLRSSASGGADPRDRRSPSGWRCPYSGGVPDTRSNGFALAENVPV